ncbi:MAG: hypothetical protein WCL32_00120 [Planctomycetota bacterium]
MIHRSRGSTPVLCSFQKLDHFFGDAFGGSGILAGDEIAVGDAEGLPREACAVNLCYGVTLANSAGNSALSANRALQAELIK